MSISIFETNISFTKLLIRHIGIDLFFFTGFKILYTIVTCIGADLFAFQRLIPTNGFKILFGTFEHRCHILAICTTAEHLSLCYNLFFSSTTALAL